MQAALIVCGTCCAIAANAIAAPPLDFENEPINYTSATPDNVVSQLQAAIDRGDCSLAFEDQFGYLRAVLKQLDVPESSQMLTFLKSSLQRPLIGPENARALYFGDDAYVGYVPDGMLEIIVTDPKLGMVFYTLEQDPAGPKFERQVARCMTCHSSSRTRNIPGLQVRSMMTDPEGEPVISAGSFRTDHSSPLNKRWGGWFVTGTHGEARHLGNFRLPDKKRPKQPVDNAAGANITDLSSLTDLSKHLTPHSDIVALMVFEHQIDAHNLMTRTSYAWQIDVHKQREAAEDAVWKQEADKLVDHLLFKDELKLDHPIQGTSRFVQDFASRCSDSAPESSRRKFDLQTRLFCSPVSYTVESHMFRNLPQPVRDYVQLGVDDRSGS
ncbi:MAG: hypothetical protein KDA81_21115 [Planctomycetaceae bacterium]|nr:hypothetical protein [Planctomycetaceae bacterium]